MARPEGELEGTQDLLVPEVHLGEGLLARVGRPGTLLLLALLLLLLLLGRLARSPGEGLRAALPVDGGGGRGRFRLGAGEGRGFGSVGGGRCGGDGLAGADCTAKLVSDGHFGEFLVRLGDRGLVYMCGLKMRRKLGLLLNFNQGWGGQYSSRCKTTCVMVGRPIDSWA